MKYRVTIDATFNSSESIEKLEKDLTLALRENKALTEIRSVNYETIEIEELEYKHIELEDLI
jgi:hypothetical protein